MSTPPPQTRGIPPTPDEIQRAELARALALLERALPLLLHASFGIRNIDVADGTDLADATDFTGASIDKLRGVLGLPPRDPNSEPTVDEQARRDGLSLPDPAAAILVEVANAWRAGDDSEIMELGAGVNQLAEEYGLPGLIAEDTAFEWDEEDGER